MPVCCPVNCIPLLKNVEVEKVLYKCAGAGDVVYRVNTEFYLQVCLDKWPSSWMKVCCHFLVGYKGQIQCLLGHYRRLSAEYHSLLARHFSEDVQFFVSLHHLQSGLITVQEQGQCSIVFSLHSKLKVEIHIHSKWFCSRWIRLKNCKRVLTSVRLGKKWSRMLRCDLIP